MALPDAHTTHHRASKHFVLRNVFVIVMFYFISTCLHMSIYIHLLFFWQEKSDPSQGFHHEMGQGKNVIGTRGSRFVRIKYSLVRATSVLMASGHVNYLFSFSHVSR